MSFTKSFALASRAQEAVAGSIRLLAWGVQTVLEFQQRRELVESGRRLREEILRDIGMQKADFL